MKKKLLTTALVLTLALSTLVGCGNNKKMYEKDVQEFVEFYNGVSEITDYATMGTEMEKLANDMDVSSDEAKQVKADFLELGKLYQEAQKYSEDPTSEELTNVLDQINELSDKIEKDAEAFGNAVDKAGVSDDALEGLYSIN